MTRNTEHWSRRAECTSVVGIRFLLAVHRLFGRAPFLTVLAPVLLFYWATRPDLRRTSFAWLEAAGRPATHREGLKRLTHFAEAMTDGFLAAAGRLKPSDLLVEGDEIFRNAQPARGCVILTSHTGCREILQVASASATDHPIVVLQYTSHARRFNELLAQAGAPKANLTFYEVDDVTPALAVELDDLVHRGAYLVIAGDRVPTGSEKATVECPFFGHSAHFPSGGAFLAMLLKVPLRMMTATRTDAPEGPRYRVRFEALADDLSGPRSGRKARLEAVMRRYASLLEAEMRAHPYDWFNFFDFWEQR